MTKLNCKCGRSNIKPHCIQCGSTNCYARQVGNVQIVLDGIIANLRGYRCRRCGTCFHEGQECHASLTELKAEACVDHLMDLIKAKETKQG